MAEPGEPFAEVGAGRVVRVGGLGGEQCEEPGEARGLLVANSDPQQEGERLVESGRVDVLELVAVLENGLEQQRLLGEVVQQGRMVDARAAGDLAHRGAAVAGLGEDVKCGVHDVSLRRASGRVADHLGRLRHGLALPSATQSHR